MMLLPSSLLFLFCLLETFLAELVVPELRSSQAKVYQSANQQSIDLVGSNFQAGISFTFEPALKVDEDYTLEIVDQNHARLNLVKGRKWRSEQGLLVATMVTIEDNVFVLGDDGVVVAWVFTDPVIFSFPPKKIHESQTHVLKIYGPGWYNILDIKVNLDPTPSSSYKLMWLDDAVLALLLNNGASWLPPHLSLKGQSADKKIFLNVTSIDSGAGMVTITPPFSLGFIIPDIKGMECNDSCEFAIDNVCDDGSMGVNDAYYGGNEPGYHRPPHPPKRNEDQTPVCALDTDCTDCGGVDAMIKRDRIKL